MQILRGPFLNTLIRLICLYLSDYQNHLWQVSADSSLARQTWPCRPTSTDIDDQRILQSDWPALCFALWRYSGPFIVNFEQMSYLLVFLLLTLNRYMPAGLSQTELVCSELVNFS